MVYTNVEDLSGWLLPSGQPSSTLPPEDKDEQRVSRADG
jgi:hypothetical protein